MSWILLVYLTAPKPIALAATSESHCLELLHYVKTVKGFTRGECLQVRLVVPK